MKRPDRLPLLILLLLVSVPSLQGMALAKAPPGADLVDLKHSEGMGYALLSRYEVFLSRDGTDWRASGLSRTGDALTAIAVGEDFILAGSESGKVYRTSDGRAWEALDPPRDPFGRKVTSLRSMAADPKGKNVLASSGMGVVRSADGGATWQAIPDPFWKVAEARQALTVGYAGRDAVVVTASGVYVESRAGFSPFTKGLPDRVEPTAAVARDGRVLLAVPREGIFEARSGRGWKKLAATPHPTLAFLGWAGGEYLAAAPFSPLFESDDKAKTWRRAGDISPAFIPLASAATAEGALIAFRGKGLMRYEGGTLFPVDLPVPLASVYAVLDTDGLRIAGTQGGVFVSEDSERSWRDVTPPTLGSPVVELLRLSDGRILSGTLGSGVFVSGDGGRTWENWSQDLKTANTVYSLVEEGGKILAATENGLMVRPLSPESSWAPADRGLPRAAVYRLVRSGDTLWAASLTGLYSAREGDPFTRMEGITGRVLSFDEGGGRIVALVDGDVLLRDAKGRIERLSRLPGGAGATAVAFLDGTPWAGSGRGVFRWSGDGWIPAGTMRYPVTRLVPMDGRIGAVTRGGGTLWFP